MTSTYVGTRQVMLQEGPCPGIMETSQTCLITGESFTLTESEETKKTHTWLHIHDSPCRVRVSREQATYVL